MWMPVKDTERDKGFYRDTLGLQITNEDSEWAEVDAKGLTIGLNGREPSGARSIGGTVITFRPQSSLEEAVGNLQERGVEVPAGISEHPWGRVATSRTARATTCSSTSRRATKLVQRRRRVVSDLAKRSGSDCAPC